MEYVNIMEAARRSGVSDKTIRRAIHTGKLSARFPKRNRCEIALSDLEQFRPGHVPGQGSTQLEQRVAELEQRVQELDQQVQQILSTLEAPKTKHPSRRAERTTGPLSKNLVPLLAFARLHSVAESKVQTHVDMGLLPVKRGEWTDKDGTVVTLALDAKGKRAFFQIYRDMPVFLRCKQCPHGYQDSAV
jgi:excisionase family DNA binding protein